MPESEDFLHCYFATLKGVLKSRRKQKARYFARLLKGGFSGAVEAVDEYEELVSLVDDPSYCELALLSLLAKLERETPIADGENELQRANRFWSQFEVEVREHFGIRSDLLASMLVRLQRSGCYAEIVGSYHGYLYGRTRTTDGAVLSP